MRQIDKLMEEFKGKLPSHSNIGGYPLYYVTENSEVLCSDCATKLVEHGEDVYVHPPQVNWETELNCDVCSKKIKSAY